MERLQQLPLTENDADDESDPPLVLVNSNTPLSSTSCNALENGISNSSSSNTESSREPNPTTTSNNTNGQSKQLSPRRRPSRIPLLGSTKSTASKPTGATTSTINGHKRHDSRDSLKSLSQKMNNNASSSSIISALSSSSSSSLSRQQQQQHLTKIGGRDSSRESLSKKNNNQRHEPTSRSLPRNNSNNNSCTNSRDSLGKQQTSNSFSRTVSIESSGNHSNPITPQRRPPAPARRSQSQTSRPSGHGGSDSNVVPANDIKVRTVKNFFWTTWLK